MQITRERLNAFGQANENRAHLAIEDLYHQSGDQKGTKVLLELPI